MYSISLQQALTCVTPENWLVSIRANWTFWGTPFLSSSLGIEASFAVPLITWMSPDVKWVKLMTNKNHNLFLQLYHQHMNKVRIKEEH